MKTAKFQADLAQTDFATLQSLMDELEVKTKADFLAKAIYLIRWAVAEKKSGRRIVTMTAEGSVIKELVTPELERVAPQLSLPSIETAWSSQELENLAKLSAEQPAEPTAHLKRLMKRKR